MLAQFDVALSVLHCYLWTIKLTKQNETLIRSRREKTFWSRLHAKCAPILSSVKVHNTARRFSHSTLVWQRAPVRNTSANNPGSYRSTNAIYNTILNESILKMGVRNELPAAASGARQRKTPQPAEDAPRVEIQIGAYCEHRSTFPLHFQHYCTQYVATDQPIFIPEML